MKIALLIFAVLVIAALLPIAFLVWRAPQGWEDETGFHLGNKGGKHE